MYVDALFDRNNEIIKVVERVNGERQFKEFKPNWDFYIPDLAGTYTSIYGDRLKKMSPKNKSDRAKLFQMYPVTFEADIDPMLRLLELEYGDKEPPTMNVAFFDIETAFDTERGYASPEDPFNPITSIAVYLQWCETMVCLAVPPKTLTFEQAEAIAEQVGNTIICKTEAQMLDMFLSLVEDADVLSGWNSSFFDIPYTVGRVIRQIDKHETRRLCLWNEIPKPKMISRGSKESLTYTLTGRVHLDYMELYKEYNYEERQSYSLDNIAEAELGERKVEYSGTLHQLYNNDFKLFLEYNIQDTMLLDKLDKKLQYIDLANTIAHNTCVTIPAAMGTVTKIDNAIVMEAHRRGMIVPNKRKITGDTRAAGGWVSKPKKGLHKWVGSSDLNSLYPSVIRAFNMSLETVVGQVDLTESVSEMNRYINAAPSHSFARYWNDRFCPPEMIPYFENDVNKSVYIKFDSGESEKLSIASLKSIIKDPAYPWVISANGTLFRTDKIGVIPSLLTKWYNERKVLQKYEKSYKKLFDNEDKGLTIPAELLDLSLASGVSVLDPKTSEGAVNLSDLEKIIESKDKEDIAKYLVSHNLKVNSNGKVIFGDQKDLKNIVGYWYKRQLVRKLSLNSTFGCVLNEASRFFDQRIGQSITLSGRNITRHMAAKTNEMLCGEYDHYGKCIVYGDTDSSYFSAWPAIKDEVKAGEIDWNKEVAAEVYDTISTEVSNTFPDFLNETFGVPVEFSEGVIESSREIVAESALFIKKKRYAAMVYDNEGVREDVNGKPGKVKAMGLDLRRADTPKFVQEFLLAILTKVLTGHEYDELIEDIRQFKDEYEKMDPWTKGTPKGVNRLTHYKEVQEKYLALKVAGKRPSKPTIPGHVQASLNWNYLRELHKDYEISPILDGSKVIVCKVKPSMENSEMKSIAFPVDETRLPDWFKNIDFDTDLMMKTVVHQKLENLLGVLGWDLSLTTASAKHFESLFGF